MTKIDERWHGKKVLITGVCNSIGQEFLIRLLKLPVASLIGLGNRRSDLFYLGERYNSEKRLRLYHGDIEDREFLIQRMAGIDIVIHAPTIGRDALRKIGAATLAETMVRSTGIVAEAARANDVQRLLFASTQEAASSDQTIAEALRESERLVSSGKPPQEDSDFAYFSARLGNIIDRPGASFPLFERQIAAGGPVVLANRDATAFMTTLHEAVDRALAWLFLAKDGEVFISRMPAFRLQDLAEVMVAALAPLHGQNASDIAIECDAAAEPERLYEEFMNAEEAQGALEYEDHSILRAPDSSRKSNRMNSSSAEGLACPYSSERSVPLAFDALWQFLVRQDLLPDRDFSFSSADELRTLP